MNDRLKDLESGTLHEEAPLSRSMPNANTSKSKSTKHKLRAVKKKMLSKMSIKEKKLVREVEVTGKDDERAIRMEAFYASVDSLQKSISIVQAATKVIEKMSDQLASCMSAHQEKQIDSKVCSTVDETNRIAQIIRSQLRLLHAETKELKKQKTVLVESDLRIREGLVSAIARKFIDELRLYQTAQQSFKRFLTNKFKRQMKAVNPTLTDEDVETLIQTGEDRDELVQEMILAPAGRVNQRIQKIRDTVTDKQEAVYQLEQSVAMVHRMFLDMALLTEEQGIQLDQIEHHVRQAGEYIEEGNDELFESIEYSKKIRKKKFMLLLIAGVLTLIIVLV